MQPTRPVIEQYADKEIVLAENQPQYIPLPVLVDDRGCMVSRWTFTDEERALIAAGHDILLFQYTFGHRFQPVKLEVKQ